MEKELIHLFQLKENDLRTDTISQAKTAIDKGIHIGGAYSSILPMTVLYYGGYIDLDISRPTNPLKDKFILSKGHAVAALASVYADMGYFDKSLLKNSRSYDSLLKGHPGPILPGVPVSTGPLGHGISISCGFAEYSRAIGGGDIYCMTGDGELQEGSNWEGIQYAASRHLDNICVIVDRNNGQSDCMNQLVVSLGELAEKFKAFGWQVYDLDGASIDAMCEAFSSFKKGVRNGKPTVIISNTVKGYGGCAGITVSHKAKISEDILEGELAALASHRNSICKTLLGTDAKTVMEAAGRMNYLIKTDKDNKVTAIEKGEARVYTGKAPVRDKKLSYRKEKLPLLEKGKEYDCDSIVKKVMSVLAEDVRVWSIDSDLANTSGLQEGVAAVDKGRALNAGIAESHMMCMAEALAVEGCNVWNSTFCVFFDWRALRRIAVSYQERLESIGSDGWLSEGHNLDITFLGTAPNLETQTNGATHMGNDDICVFGEVAHLKIIDISCPNQLLKVMQWIAEGNRGLVYVRVPRFSIAALYPEPYSFEYGKGYWVKRAAESDKVIVSSGRGVHEALLAARLLEEKGEKISVIDMPTFDGGLFKELISSKKHILVEEQNNGYLYRKLGRLLLDENIRVGKNQIDVVNCSDAGSQERFIHSGTYGQLTKALGLDADNLVKRLR